MNATIFNMKKHVLDLEHELALTELRLETFDEFKTSDELLQKEQALQKESLKVTIDLLKVKIEKAKKEVASYKPYSNLRYFNHIQ